ncbi:hypothetical protein ACF06P_35485 [Streptomyces sp. NPDC015684]|uniref:hypothetical protein n=1 Tax=Streptomyces sp. NPDC015684 TaxID=3364963 RepID=UPI0037020523
MRFYVMSGPHQGETGEMTDGVGEIRLSHPMTRDVLCRYRVNSTDAMIEQEGFESGVQLHYAGDVPRLE